MSNLATANYKTVTAFLNQVKELEDQLLPDQEKGKGSTKTWKAPTDLESFTKLKYELNLTLKDLRTKVTQVEKLRRSDEANSGRRKAPTIAAISRTEDKLLGAMDQCRTLAKLWRRLAKRKQLPEPELRAKADLVKVISDELNFLYERNCRIPKYEEKESVFGELSEQQKAKQAQFRNNVRVRSSNDDEPLNDEDWDEELSPQEKDFLNTFLEDSATQRHALRDIGEGVQDLKRTTGEITKTLLYQQAVSKEILGQMETVDQELEFGNEHLKNMIDRHGGSGLWCTRLMCVTFLVILIFAFLNMVLGV